MWLNASTQLYLEYQQALAAEANIECTKNRSNFPKTFIDFYLLFIVQYKTKKKFLKVELACCFKIKYLPESVFKSRQKI